MNVSNKSRGVAMILVLVLGFIGAHRYYLGKPVSATIMLVLTLTVLGVIVSGVWAIVDAVVILLGKAKDGKGQVVGEW